MGLFDFLKVKKTKQENNVLAIVKSADTVSEPIAVPIDNGLEVYLEKLPDHYLDAANLVEITDSRVITRINSIVPTIGSTGVSVGNIIKNITAQSSDTPLYKVVLQKGGKLADSRNMAGAKRAMAFGPNGIKENANLIEVAPKIDKAGVMANTGSAVMGIASMVVGQYYMHQVDAQLGAISDCLFKVVDFLDVQYKSQVASLMESVYNISKFQISSIENEELRNRELDNIQQLRIRCQELLNQAEITLEKFSNNENLNYDKYVDIVGEIGKWHQCQAILVQLLYQINILDFALHAGIKSKEQCFGSFALHAGKVDSIHIRLVEWHKSQCELLKIDLAEGRRRHIGLLAWLEKPISLINDDWNYKAIGTKTIDMIKEQTCALSPLSYSDDNLFDSDVQIVAKDGKYYYLPVLNKNTN